MSDTLPSPIDKNLYDDEISISELLMKLWAKRGLIVTLPLILASLTLIGLLVGKTSQQNEVSLYIELNGISVRDAVNDSDGDSDKGVTTRYPNGTLFSPQDLTNPTVISQLAKQTGLNASGLTNNIDVQFGTPFSNGVLAEYKAALGANSKASIQDLVAINAQYERKLEAAAKRGLKVTVDYGALEVPKDMGAQIAEKLLQIWNQVYTTQFVTFISPAIASLRWTEDQFDLTSAIGLQEADIQLTNLKQGVDLISKDNRLKGITTERGTLAADLAGYIDEFRAIFFEPLFLGAFNQNDTLSRVYARDLKLRLTELDREIDEINQRLVDIRGFQSTAQSSTKGASSREAPQLDGDALSTVVNLAEQAALSSYLQTSLDQRFDLIQKRAILITRLDRIIADDSTEQIGEDFVSLAQNRYERIISSYEEILLTAKGLLVAQTPVYYSVTALYDHESPLIERRDLLFLALAIALGGMLAVIAALLWPQRQND